MQPTAALFDAINRGDITAARDALNRGADLSSVNILGMTPMELSVDLGRNDISFLLLSMRGEDSDRGSRTARRTENAPPPRTVQASRPVQAARTQPFVQRNPAANTQAPAKTAATPKLFANDGGAPVPAAGFLGFDSHTTTN